ncbi:MAG: hypothetical protein JST50_05055 [Bacteroidetes bacterium]|jgi:hypothetical protein|nr:hypothetical protein [Bacteroidota bacterium]
MKSLKVLTLTCFAIVIVMLFSKCHHEGEGGLKYNKDSALVHLIPMDTAIKLTTTFRLIQKETARKLRDSSYIVNFPLAEKFNRDAILALLDQKGARGVRIYLGEDKTGPVKMVLVAVDSLGNDITGRKKRIARFSSNGGGQDALAVEAGQRCPTMCSVSSVLN